MISFIWLIFTIFIAIVIFAVIVLIHEFGHFYAARKFGVKVEEFGLGIPPRAKKLFTDKKGTLFSLNWIPFGGFVKITGENPNFFEIYDENKNLIKDNLVLIEKIKKREKLFNRIGEEISKEKELEILTKIKEESASYNLMNKPAWQKSIILLAGVFMNFVLAFVIFTILFFVGVKPIGINTFIKTDLDIKLIPNIEQAEKIGFLSKKDGIILIPVKDSLAEKSGIKAGDWLTKINGKTIKKPDDLIKIFRKNTGKIISLNIKRNPNFNEKKENTFPTNENIKEIKIKLKLDSNGKIGSYISPYIKENPDFEYKYGIIDSIKYGFLETKNQTILTFVGLKNLGQKIFIPKNKTERKEALDSMSGPIGIVNIITKIAEKGLAILLIFGAIISINLGVMNLLPIPALDGGRFFIVIINEFFKKIFGKKIITPYREAIIHSLFFIVLMGLIMFITYNDIMKLF